MKVLVIDDSVVFRSAIKTALLNSGDIDEVDIAANGKIAIDKLKQNHFDAVTLDIEMPVMDGIETATQIRTFNQDIPIIVFSAQNPNAAGKTIMALQKGASDFVQKIQGSHDVNENLKMIEVELVPRLKALLGRREVKDRKAIRTVKALKSSEFLASLVCIASSTGGPDMLMKVFAGLEKLRTPILLVQHMPPLFTTQLADVLNAIGKNTVVEAKSGDYLEPGICYLAPGDYHMEIVKTEDARYQIQLQQGDKVCYVRPAADVTFKSVASVYHGNVASFVFTGMGQDGLEGCKALKQKNALVVIQDQASSVVWGMPGAIYAEEIQDEILDPENIIKAINRVAR